MYGDVFVFMPDYIVHIHFFLYKDNFTIKGGSRRSQKSHEVLMMMKAAKLEFAGSACLRENEKYTNAENFSCLINDKNQYI